MINSPLEYDKMARVEEKLWWYKILHEKVLKSFFFHNIRKDALIVDLGCGTGGLLQKLSENGYNAIGIDISESAIGFCKKKILM